MQKVIIVATGSPYANDKLFNALRLAIALTETEPLLNLSLFLLSDAVTGALPNQHVNEGYNIQQMLEILLAQGVSIKLCQTCIASRGIKDVAFIEGITIGTMADLAQWTLNADKVLTF